MTDPTAQTATPPIRRPDAPHHLMWVKPAGRRIRIRAGEEILAETTEALRVVELGRDLYDPVYDLPMDAVRVPLRASDKTSHCPLKGDASYFDWVGPDGAVRVESLAWSYRAAFDFAEILSDRIAFYPQRVTIEDAPAD